MQTYETLARRMVKKYGRDAARKSVEAQRDDAVQTGSGATVLYLNEVLHALEMSVPARGAAA